MTAQEITDLVNNISGITEINDAFEYIGYEIPKQAQAWDVLVIGDLDEDGICVWTHLIEFRIIWKADQTAIKIKSYVDLLDNNILKNHNLGYSRVIKFDESRPILDSDGRFEKVITYKFY